MQWMLMLYIANNSNQINAISILVPYHDFNTFIKFNACSHACLQIIHVLMLQLRKKLEQ